MTKPTWSSGSFLVYAGGFTVFGAAVAALEYLSSQYGDGAYVLWALLVLAVLYAIADRSSRHGHPWTAAVFGFAAVFAWAAFVAALFTWWGWLGKNESFGDWSWSRLALELLVLAAALDDRRRFKAPLLTLIVALVGWFFVIDLITAGGNWTATVTLLVGLFYLALSGSSARPSAFWYSLVSGLLVSGALLYWWHADGDWGWALIGVASVVYVLVAKGTRRSSWAVLGALGLLAVATKYAIVWTASSISFAGGIHPITVKGWIPPLVFAVTGFVIVALGWIAARKRA